MAETTETDMERLRRFFDELPSHDGSVGLALLELVRRAGPSGAAARTDWLAAVRGAHARIVPDDSMFKGQDDVDATEQLSRYMDEHVLKRLRHQGFVAPAQDGHDDIQLASALWEQLAPQRDAVVVELEAAVRNLLQRGEVGGAPAVTSAPSEASTLQAHSLVKVYRKRKVVNDVDLEVSQGEIVGLLGPNGAGKTTTFYMIVGLINPERGRVFLDERELTGVPMYKRARAGIGYLAQEPSVFRKLTVEENILAILETMGLSKQERAARLEDLLDELGLKHLRDAKAYSLSGGERRRLEITRALVSRPKFMLLDEPFAGVDPIAVHDIQQIVADLRHRGIGVIITDHNVEQTLEIVDRAYIMYDGRVRVSGTVAELVWNDEVAEIYFGPTLTARMRERYLPPDVV
jgi:lipopolysaccharide export system ATP-binding protein